MGGEDGAASRDSATLGAHLERGERRADSLEELARRLARFHARADAGAEGRRGRVVRGDRRNARENFEQSAPQVGVTLSQVDPRATARR